MFPVLTEAQIARMSRFGTEWTVRAGELLFDEGERDVPFHVVLDGEVEIR